ncbi:MAG: hypothetical protein FWG53_08220, partial [Clostridiales bacterium]|nr:hypothetical protein [Clostridiales bacterium]
MQTKQRKPIALLLAAMMVAGLFVSMPLTASAAGSTGDSGDEYSINIGLSDNEDDIRIKIRN